MNRRLWLAPAVLAVLIPTLARAGTLPAGYAGLDGCAKQALLWNERVEPTRYSSLPPLSGGGWTALLGSVRSLFFLSQTFDHAADEMPEGRDKVIHAHGSVAAVAWRAVPRGPFSGLYATSACGLARLSLAGSPAVIGFTPGLALKLFVDGRPSVNLHVMHSLNGQGSDRDPFAHTFGNELPPPRGLSLRALDAALAAVGRDLRRLEVAHVARVNADGTDVASPAAPRRVAFVPAQTGVIASDSRADFRDELAARLAPGAKIYDVYGMADDGTWSKVAELTLASTFVASEWGDRELFFQHAD